MFNWRALRLVFILLLTGVAQAEDFFLPDDTQPGTLQYDVTCAYAIGLQMRQASQALDDGLFRTFLAMQAFYYGHLSVRDESTDWGMPILGRVAKAKGHASLSVLKPCMDWADPRAAPHTR